MNSTLLYISHDTEVIEEDCNRFLQNPQLVAGEQGIDGLAATFRRSRSWFRVQHFDGFKNYTPRKIRAKKTKQLVIIKCCYNCVIWR